MDMETIDIFDYFLREDSKRQDKIKAQELVNQNRLLSMECGSCNLWMTKQCPRESRGIKVSTKDPVCSQLSLTRFTVDLINSNKKAINELKL